MEENKEAVRETEIDLRVILGILKKYAIAIIALALAFSVTFYVYSKFFIQKQYAASAMIIVNNKNTDKTNYVNNTELIAAQNLADVYAIIIKSDTVLQQVINNRKLNMTYEQLRNSITVSTVNSTQVIEISMRHTSAEYAKTVVSEILAVAPKIIEDTVEAGSVKIVSKAKISNNGNPVSPNSQRNALIGGLVGAVLMLAIVFIKEMLNNTFKTEEDIVNTLSIPLIGIIPEVDEKEFNKNV